MKVPDAVIKVKDLDLVEFMDSVQVMLNNGLYEMRLISEVPDWFANNGESAIYAQGTARRLYVYVNTWSYIGWNTIGSLTLFDADGDTGISPEATPNEDVIRFYIAGINKFAMGSMGLALTDGTPLVLDGTDGDTKWVHNSGTNYLEGYVDGVLRVEL